MTLPATDTLSARLRSDAAGWTSVSASAPAEHTAALERMAADALDEARAQVAAAVAAERERCADIADQYASIEGIAQQIAAAIRAAGTRPQ